MEKTTDDKQETERKYPKLEQWLDQAIAFLSYQDCYRSDAVYLSKDRSRALSSLCSLRVRYTVWKSKCGREEFHTSYTEMMRLTEILAQDRDAPGWRCWMKYFIFLSGTEWAQLWDDVDEILQDALTTD